MAKSCNQKGKILYLQKMLSETEMAVDAMRNGAFDFIEKPSSSDKLLSIIDIAIQQSGSQKIKINLDSKRVFDTCNSNFHKAKSYTIRNYMPKQYILQINLLGSVWQKKDAAQCKFCIGSDPLTHTIYRPKR